MSRLRDAIAIGRAIIPYLTASDGGDEAFLAAALGAVEGGARVLEVGVPFSDPVADGPVIQGAHARALAAGGGALKALALVGRLRERSSIPVVLFTYLNPVLAVGSERFISLARGVGIDGVLTLDAPPEEEPGWFTSLSQGGLDPVVLLSPNTAPERARTILRTAGGFAYIVSREGITGTHAGASGGLEDRIRMIRQRTDLPLAVGFGVRERRDVEDLWKVAEGAVVGSALVEKLAAAGPGRAFETARDFVKGLTAEAQRAQRNKENERKRIFNTELMNS
jgi:tryptophan synthase alpha chain